MSAPGILAAAEAIVARYLPCYSEDRAHRPYHYLVEGACIRCDSEGPIMPQGEEPWCFRCHGYALLACGKHVMSILAITCGGTHEENTHCAVCSHGASPISRNHTHA